MNCLAILVNGFEDSEAITTIDVLRRAKIDVDAVTVYPEKTIKSAHGFKVEANKTLKEIDYTSYDILLLPGGPAVFKELHQLEVISLIILDYAKKNKIIASICAAPSLVGKLGLFEGKKYTCFPGCDGPITKGTNTGKEVVVDGNYITARSMYYSADFAIAIIDKALGSAKAKEIKNQIMGKN